MSTMTNRNRVSVRMGAQPDDVTCGPTCLSAIYQFHKDPIAVETLVSELNMLQEGGTLAVFLANHALARGYRATIYTYNLNVFDPTWFGLTAQSFAARLTAQREIKQHDAKLQLATDGYLEFLERGGELCFEDLTPKLLRRLLAKNVPLLTGLSSTYLYRNAREDPVTCIHDDIGGEPQGHFVVLCNYLKDKRQVEVADPYADNPMAEAHHYEVDIDRLIGAILLGIISYDANILAIEAA